MQRKIKTLCKVANALNKEKITWALGGSGALHFFGLLDGFRDVDLMLAAQDVERAVELLNTIEGLESTGFEEAYSLYQYKIDGLEFDVMQGFRFGQFAYTLQKEDIISYAVVDGVSIPLHSVLVWREFYRLMGRQARVELIDSYIIKER